MLYENLRKYNLILVEYPTQKSAYEIYKSSKINLLVS